MINQSIDRLPNTSPLTIKKFKSIDIHSYFDLLNYFPIKYDDLSKVTKINSVIPGQTVTIIGKIIEAKYQFTRTHLKIQSFKIDDETGVINCNFFNQPYLLRLMPPGTMVAISGLINQFGRQITIEPKSFEIVGQLKNKLIHTGNIIPVYSEKKGLTSKLVREKIYKVLNQFQFLETLPHEILTYNQLIDRQTAFKNIHFPESLSQLQKATNRLSFDELFIIQLQSQVIKNFWQKQKVNHHFKFNDQIKLKISKFINSLPFILTDDQKNVWKEIQNDLIKKNPMNRFLQGEVGSGKTVVAALAAYLAILNKTQVLLMAPTEILANQHYRSFLELFNYLKSEKPKIALITGSTTKKLSQVMLKKTNLIIGTHALISPNKKFNQVGLVIIDEQHRFGVNQRAMLSNKADNPHILTMTATPIPRTVALTLYGQLDLSIINQMPAQRLPIKSYYVPKNKRQSCYQWIKDQIQKNKTQAYIVCPLIEDSDSDTLKSVKAATSEFQNLKSHIFKDQKVGLLHGRLTSNVKESIMNDFKNHKIDILITTPVVEVGIDIPNATIMIIEAAERFGLSQLHQLRGRIGRGTKQSYCFLFSEKEELPISSRLKFFAKTNNGNLLAEKDLETRGPGNIYGLKQHGFINLKIAKLNDYQLIKTTKKAVEYFLKNCSINDYPELKTQLTEIKTIISPTSGSIIAKN